MTDALELDALWEDFHRVVNMTSQELAAWLRVRDADETTEPLPDQAGSATGQHVLAILQKRRTDLTEDDLRVMRKVVETVTDQVDLENEPEPEVTAEDTRRRHRLMRVGHDPLWGLAVGGGVRVVRELVGAHGRTYAEEAGIALKDTPRPLYRLLVLSPCSVPASAVRSRRTPPVPCTRRGCAIRGAWRRPRGRSGSMRWAGAATGATTSGRRPSSGKPPSC